MIWTPGAEKQRVRPNLQEEWEGSTDKRLRIANYESGTCENEQNKVHTEIGCDKNNIALNRAHSAEQLLSDLIVYGKCSKPFAMWEVRY